MPEDLKRTHVVVPMKPLAESKTRLRERVPKRTADALVLLMLQRVLAAVTAWSDTKYDCEVVGGDDDVRRVAAAAGARWRPDGGRGLNGEVRASMEAAYAQGFEAALYLPGDLPLIRRDDIFELLYAARKGNRPVAVPADNGGGTNALLVPAGIRVTPELGENSYVKHREAAKRAGTTQRTMKLPGVMLDVDTAADYERARRRAFRLPNLVTDWEIWLLEGMKTPMPASGVYPSYMWESLRWRTP